MQVRDAGRDEIGRVLAACDDAGRLLSLLRLRSLSGVLDGRPVRIAWVETPFVAAEFRAGGRAVELVARALEQAPDRGHDLAILTSASAEVPKAQGGFRALPCGEAACRTFLPAPWPKEPSWLQAGEEPFAHVPGLRPGGTDDIDAVASIHAEAIAGQRLRIVRERGAWERIFLARDLVRRLRGIENPFWVIDRGGRVECYVILDVEPPTLRWREHGARRGAETLLADLFWSSLAWARGRRLQRIEGWFMPEVLTRLPLYPTSDRRRNSNLVMLLALEPKTQAPVFAREEECRLWELDAF